MFWIIFFLIICFVLPLKILRRDGTFLVCLPLALAAAVSGILLGWGVASFVGTLGEERWEVKGEYDLVALRDTEGIAGRFFLGGGTINDVQYYQYYYEYGKGFKMGRVDASGDVIVFEENRNDGKLIIYKPAIITTIPKVFYIYTPDKTRSEFHIPVGSILRTFQLN